ncbi:tudor domain-containing protein 5 [Elysia marginata]|uniref:Tudor domain-containing protein 5 n=1 Tax=Elysia marginata TaxID=1093978 RepID=A0AAV4G9E4_9GAST|nr:tudor domain-containing protein 5 [Elysia marginata]
MDEDKKRAVFEQLKIELRSILLSSKDGVPEHLILSDYEMLSCQRLPYKTLGYRSVAALLGDMPDVAREIRLASGDVIYKAVSNESTAHIQRLVGNQKSAKKKPGRGRGAARGRGGIVRGGFARGGRGGRGGSFRGSLTSRFAGSDRGRGGSFAPRGARARGGRFHSSPSKENVNPRGFGGPRGMSRSSDHGFAGDVRGFNTTSTLNSNRSNHNPPIAKHEGKPREDIWEDCEEERHEGFMQSPVRQSSSECKQELSPMINLKIGLGSDGQRNVVAGSPIKSPVKHVASSEMDAVTPGGQIDIRRMLEEQKQAKEKAKASKNPLPSNAPSVSERKKVARGFLERCLQSVVKYNKEKGSTPVTENQDQFRKNLPPRFMKQQKQDKHHNAEDSTPKFSPEKMPQLQEQRALHTITSKNWEPPEDGPRYLEAYYKYFADRGESAPQIKVVMGRVKRERGFYGQLHYEGVCHFPLGIEFYSIEEKRGEKEKSRQINIATVVAAIAAAVVRVVVVVVVGGGRGEVVVVVVVVVNVPSFFFSFSSVQSH